MPPLRISLALLLTAASTALVAQAPAGPSLQDPTQPTSIPDFHIPIHTAPDDPTGGAYGTWAAGDQYKVSLGREIGFYPVLGPEAPRHLPVTWRTTSVRSGKLELLDAPARTRHDGGYRFEVRHGRVTEVWEVRRDGLMQSFVVERPATDGDLVVEGTVKTELRAIQPAPGHGPIEFVEAGEPTVRYGAAFAIDADGRTLPIASELTEHGIRLRVPADWLEHAAWPVTIDPLLSTRRVATGSGPIASTDICRDDRANQLLTVLTRLPTAADADVYAYLSDDAVSRPLPVFTDITTNWKSYVPRVAWVGGANRWAISFQRIFASSIGLRTHLHDGGDLTLSTSVVYLPSRSGQIEAFADIGGTTGFGAGTHAMLVFEVHQTTTSQSTPYGELWAVRLDAANGVFGTPVRVSPYASGTRYDHDRAAINQDADDGWVTVYEERDRSSSTPDPDIMIARLRPDGTVAGHGRLDGSSSNEVMPQVAGREGRYLVTYGVQDGNSAFPWRITAGIAGRRVDWTLGRFPNFAARQWLRGSAGGAGVWVNEGLAYDSLTRSFWQVATSRVDSANESFRVGYDLRVVETVRTLQQGTTAAITFDDDANEFVLAHNDRASRDNLWASRIGPPAGSASSYGTGCGGGSISHVNAPLLGSQFFTVRLRGARANQPALLFLDGRSANTPLDGIGLPGCTLLVTSSRIALPDSTDANGAIDRQMPIPGIDTLRDLRFQWLWFAPGANALGLQLSQGLAVQTR